MVSYLKTFTHKGCKITAQKKFVFLLIFPCKARQKPSFLMDERPLVEGCIPNFGISLDIFEFLVELQCIVEALQRGGTVAVAVLVMTFDRLHVTSDT